MQTDENIFVISKHLELCLASKRSGYEIDFADLTRILEANSEIQPQRNYPNDPTYFIGSVTLFPTTLPFPISTHLLGSIGLVCILVWDDLVEIPPLGPDVVHQDLVRREGELVKRSANVGLRHVLQLNAITQFPNNLPSKNCGE